MLLLLLEEKPKSRKRKHSGETFIHAAANTLFSVVSVE